MPLMESGLASPRGMPRMSFIALLAMMILMSIRLLEGQMTEIIISKTKHHLIIRIISFRLAIPSRSLVILYLCYVMLTYFPLVFHLSPLFPSLISHLPSLSSCIFHLISLIIHLSFFSMYLQFISKFHGFFFTRPAEPAVQISMIQSKMKT